MDPSLAKLSEPPSSEAILFSQLCDAVTHLPPAPWSTREGQLLTFRLLDGVLRLQDQSQGDGEMVSDTIPDVIRTSNAKVLFGENEPASGRCHCRSHLLASFFDRVQVCSARSLEQKYHPVDSSVHVDIADYVTIVDRISASLDASDGSNHDISAPGCEFEDVCAKAVHDFIYRRILTADDEHTSGDRSTVSDSKAAQTIGIFAQKHPNVSALASLNILILRTASQR
ncbi:hypothetical protein BD410DRAFT_328035 [Rickenella mellea]|uniref:Uncharacterized protein n=1 Tax=Rickenella mellea TaxID=50990 RepID=A0A4Y7QK70_9AGAM|nr:hypothetical protein BD410DRAFT_328035 [Rickenella mellea]